MLWLRAAAPVVMLVFRDIGQMREIGKRAHHRDGLVAGQFLEQSVKLGPGPGFRFAAEAHRGLAYGFHHIVDSIAFLSAQHIAQQPTQQSYVILERSILVDIRFAGGLSGAGVFFSHDERMQSVLIW